MTDRKYIENFLSDLASIAQSISRDEIEGVLNEIYAAWKRDAQVFIIGNGGSAGTASHFAADLNKCSSVPGKRRIRAISLVDNTPLCSALTNDEGWENIYVEQLKNFFRPGDLVLAISVHGGSGADKAGPWSQNILKALKHARENGGRTAGFSGFDGGALAQYADACAVVRFNSTPLVESFHVALHHLMAFRLAEKIRDSES